MFVFLLPATAPALGSRTLTLGVAVAFLATLFAFLIGRNALAPDRYSMFAAMSAAAYALVKVVFTLAHSGTAGLHTLQGSALFLTPLFLIPFLRRTDPRRILDAAVLGCGFSTLLAVPAAAYQILWIGERAQAGSGNAGVFAVLALIMGSIGTLNIAAGKPVRRLLGLLSWLSMVFCVLASGMRGIWIAVPLTTGLAIWAVWPYFPARTARRGLFAVLAVLVIGIGFAGDAVWNRAALLGSDVVRILEDGDYNSSTGRRLLMYGGAFDAIMDAPLSGYGIHKRMSAVRAHVPEELHPLVSYNHPHNGFLATLLDAGIVGLCALLFLLAAPAWIAVNAPRDEAWRIRVATALILTTGYLASGMTNILFEHDLMDSAYIFLLVVIVATVPRSGGRRANMEV